MFMGSIGLRFLYSFSLCFSVVFSSWFWGLTSCFFLRVVPSLWSYRSYVHTVIHNIPYYLSTHFAESIIIFWYLVIYVIFSFYFVLLDYYQFYWYFTGTSLLFHWFICYFLFLILLISSSVISFLLLVLGFLLFAFVSCIGRKLDD